jgi:hypothetical protein
MLGPSLQSGFTRESGYPRGQRTDGVDIVVDKANVAATNFTLATLDPLENLMLGALVVVDIGWEVNAPRSLVAVTIRYGEPTAGGYTSLKDGIEEWSLDDSGQEIPIDKRKNDGSLWFSNYKTNHNHILAAKDGVTASPAWWSTATDLTDAGSESDYRWIKDVDSLPDGYYVLEDKTKNIETVIVPSPVVVGTTKYKSYSRAVNKKVASGTVADPAKKFGLSGQFLVVGSSVNQDGRRWVVETRYQQATEWDSDYYA